MSTISSTLVPASGPMRVAFVLSPQDFLNCIVKERTCNYGRGATHGLAASRQSIKLQCLA
jgi:hypothetical protein